MIFHWVKICSQKSPFSHKHIHPKHSWLLVVRLFLQSYRTAGLSGLTHHDIEQTRQQTLQLLLHHQHAERTRQFSIDSTTAPESNTHHTASNNRCIWCFVEKTLLCLFSLFYPVGVSSQEQLDIYVTSVLLHPKVQEFTLLSALLLWQPVPNVYTL